MNCQVNDFKNKLLLQLIVVLILSYLIMIFFIIVSDKTGPNSQGKYILLRIFSFSFFFFKVGGISIMLCYILNKIKKVKYILYLMPLIYFIISQFFEKGNVIINIILPVIIFFGIIGSVTIYLFFKN